VVSLFTNVLIEESLQIIKTKLDTDQEKIHFNLKTEVIMEILEVCMRTAYFQMVEKSYKQKEGMVMGSPLSPVVSNIFMETFKQLAFTAAQLKRKMWLRYVDDTVVIWPRALSGYRNFLITSVISDLPLSLLCR
jgi:hypothetical protein